MEGWRERRKGLREGKEGGVGGRERRKKGLGKKGGREGKEWKGGEEGRKEAVKEGGKETGRKRELSTICAQF